MKRVLSCLLMTAILICTVPVFVVHAEGVPGWNVSVNGAIDASASVVTDPQTGAGYLRMGCNTDIQTGDKFMVVSQNIPVEYGKTYIYGFRAKATEISKTDQSVNWVKRLDLAPFKNTYDWTKYEFIYNHNDPNTTEAVFMFNMSGRSKELCIDDIYCYEYEGQRVGNNLISNGSFDSNVTPGKNTEAAGDIGLEAKIENIKNSERFTEPEFSSLYGGLRYAPVYPAKDIKIDGDLSDWEGYPKSNLPTKKEQIWSYLDSDYSVTGSFQYAWDEENFYLGILVNDDKHIGNNGGDFWREDSIQTSFSSVGEELIEIGFSIDNDGVPAVHSDALSSEQLDSIQLKSSLTDKTQVYEAAIPWSVKYEKRPESILFNGLINVNDGAGRAYCVQLARGISEGKFTDENPILVMLDDAKDYDTWIEGDMKATQNEKTPFSFYYVNRGPSKEVLLEIPAAGVSEKYTLGQNEGINKKFEAVFSDNGLQEITAYVTTDGKKEEVKFKVTVDIDYGIFDEAYFKGLDDKCAEIADLLKKCEEKGIATDYERINYTILERYSKLMKEELDLNLFVRIEYYANCLEDLYRDAKENLTAYLNGEKTSEYVPRYTADDIEIDGRTIIGTTEKNGETERRPVFFNGYGHFAQTERDIPNFQNFGTNIIQTEIGPANVLKKKGSVIGWNIYGNNGYKLEATVDEETVYDGKYSAKLTSGDAAPGQFATISQSIEVKPNTTYYYGLSAKAENAGAVTFFLRGKDDRKNLSGTYDWTEQAYTYTTGEEETRIEYIIAFDGASGNLNVDNAYMKEGEDGKNLLRNGDFEAVTHGDDMFDIDTFAIERVQDVLQEADDNNIAISFLLCGHYFPDFLYEEYPDLKLPTQMSFFGFELTHPVARQVWESFCKVIIPEIKDYACVNNIQLANEPGMTVCYSDYNLPQWYEYLKNVYGGDINKLNEAYGTSYTAFEEVEYPRDPDTKAFLDDGTVRSYDFLQFNSGILVEYHKFMADVVHKYAPDMPLSTKEQNPYGMVDWRDPRVTWINCMGPKFEDVMDITEISGNDAWWMLSAPAAGTTLNEKLFWYDSQRAYGGDPIFNTEDHIMGDGDPRYVPEHAPRIYTDLWQGAIHGRTASVIWLWDRSYDSAGMMAHHIGMRPDCIKKVGDANLDMNRLSYEMAEFQNAKRDVGVLYSNASRSYSMAHMEHAFSAYKSLLYSGQKVEIITEKVAEKIHDYKMIVLPGLTNVTANTLNEVKKYIEGGGKVIIMGEDTLKKDEHQFDNDAELVKYIFDNSTVIPTTSSGFSMTSPSYDELRAILVNGLKDAGLYTVDVIDTKTGKTAENVEWQTVEYNGKTLINLCNYKFYNPLELKIVINGNECTKSKDLISGEEFGAAFPLNPYEPVMLQID